MKLVTLEKVYNCLKDETPEINVDMEISKRALSPIKKMLEISESLGL